MLQRRMALQRFLSCRLRDYREYWRLTQHDLSEYLGVSLRSVQRWEAAEALPDLAVWARVVVETDLNADPRGAAFLVDYP